MVLNSSGEIRNSKIISNSGICGGGIDFGTYASQQASLYYLKTSLTNNVKDANYKLLINNCEISDNTTIGPIIGAGAICAACDHIPLESISIIDCIIRNNHVKKYEGNNKEEYIEYVGAGLFFDEGLGTVNLLGKTEITNNVGLDNKLQAYGYCENVIINKDPSVKIEGEIKRVLGY